MNILVADDDKYILKLIVKILEKEGHVVFSASNGFEAIKVLKKNDAIELIITDIIMPDKEGIETIIDIKKMYSDKKIIAMSGGGKLNADGYLLLAKNFGADVILKKPFDNVQLLKAVESIK